MVPVPAPSSAPHLEAHGRSAVERQARYGLGGRASYSEHRPLRVLVVDAQEIVYFGFRLLLTEQPWIERCLLASGMTEAAELARRYEPHVALVDAALAQSAGRTPAAALRRAHPNVRMVLMTSGERLPKAMAVAAGACGVVSKAWPTADLATAVRKVGMGMTLFAQEPGPEDPRLSQRERDVIALIAGGATNREIGSRLHLSPNTVKQHASALYRKLEARNRAEAVRRAQQMGVIC